MIVVSTAFGNAEAVQRCCASVRAEGLRHRFAAADAVSFSAAVGAGCETVIHDSACQLHNLRALVATIAPHEIVVWLDGDDALLPGAAERVDRAYRFGPWLTYGAFQYDGLPDYTMHRYFRLRYPGPDQGPRRFRDSAWRASHLRTFRAGLFQRIPDSYFKRPDGSYLEYCTDRAVMLPMLEMCGERYGVVEHEICDYKLDHQRAMTVRQIQDEARDDEFIRAMHPLPEIEP